MVFSSVAEFENQFINFFEGTFRPTGPLFCLQSPPTGFPPGLPLLAVFTGLYRFQHVSREKERNP
jgi:hypothetical protein